MAHKRKNRAGHGTPGRGRNFSAGKQKAPAHKALAGQATASRRNRPHNDAVWDTCREAQEAAASREARNAARLKSAALSLNCGFVQSGARWERQCPGCKRLVELRIEPNGEVYAISYYGFCDGILRIHRLLSDAGFQ
ncbi:hypothetical protein [Bradyrhizobium sp. 6(2017)]|uniref:hypothetical protein n=1 Tax=Bradyrhizobium sp. 6(2017) TaxID=1197460 RepID=UPI0013E19334|nr:hypothetical protein [Bradyrhizobium sp. 6(2017)]QIG96590.1 hypothetical protein G6P99_32090 [Bradyrhizobium sp. 6(2017)]